MAYELWVNITDTAISHDCFNWCDKMLKDATFQVWYEPLWMIAITSTILLLIYIARKREDMKTLRDYGILFILLSNLAYLIVRGFVL